MHTKIFINIDVYNDIILEDFMNIIRNLRLKLLLLWMLSMIIPILRDFNLISKSHCNNQNLPWDGKRILDCPFASEFVELNKIGSSNISEVTILIINEF